MVAKELLGGESVGVRMGGMKYTEEGMGDELEREWGPLGACFAEYELPLWAMRRHWGSCRDS